MVCLGDDEETSRVCTANHRVCVACAGGIARNFASDPGEGRVKCPAGMGGACGGHAETDLLVLALAAGGEDVRDDITAFLTVLTSVAEGPAETRGKAEGAEAARRQLLDSSKVDAVVRRIREEVMLERCPRCEAPFLDYDGCNALICPKCGCGFCAVCLEDCGGDAHAHAASYGDVFNKASANAARKERWRAGVHRELEALSREARDRAVAVMEVELFDLGLGPEPSRRVPRECSSERFERRARRCVAELEELMEHFKSGKASSFEAVNARMVVVDLLTDDRAPREQIRLLWNETSGCHEVHVRVNDPELTAEEKQARAKVLETHFSQACFVKCDFGVDARVYATTKKYKEHVSIDPDAFARARTLEVMFYQSVGREAEALMSCRRLLEEPSKSAEAQGFDGRRAESAYPRGLRRRRARRARRRARAPERAAARGVPSGRDQDRAARARPSGYG